MAPDQIWMFQGDLPSELDEYFDGVIYIFNNGNFWDPTDSARLQDLKNDKLYSAFNKNGIFTTGPWQPGSADDLNDDKFLDRIEHLRCKSHPILSC